MNCLGMQGFETERHQLGLGGARNWRPGEKAFPPIEPAKLIAYVKIKRLGMPPDSGWSFEIDKEESWTFFGDCSIAQREFINEGLRYWRGRVYVVPADWDLAY